MSPDFQTPTPTPPVIGFTGKPLTPEEGSDEFREQTPEGGYILWKREKVKGNDAWMPYYFPPPKGTQA